MIFRAGDVVRIANPTSNLNITRDYTGVVTGIEPNSSTKIYVRLRHEGSLHNLLYQANCLELECDPDRLLYAEELRNATR